MVIVGIIRELLAPGCYDIGFLTVNKQCCLTHPTFNNMLLGRIIVKPGDVEGIFISTLKRVDGG